MENKLHSRRAFVDRTNVQEPALGKSTEMANLHLGDPRYQIKWADS